MLKKILFGSGILLSTLQAGDNAGADVSFSGYIDADMAGDIVKGSKVEYQSNQEIDLTASIKYGENVSVDLFVTNNSGNVPYGGGGDRWTALAFDGAVVNWATDFGTLMFGDLVMNAGNISYYTYKRAIAYAAIMKETYTRGIGLGLNNGASIYLGANDGNNNQADMYLSYEFGSDAFKAVPFLYAALGKRNVPVKLGTDFSGAAGDLSYSGAIGMIRDPHKDPTYNFLFEPTYSMGDISIAASGFYSIQEKAIADRSGFTADDVSDFGVTDEWYVYVEPGMSFNDNFAAGLPLELHGGQSTANGVTANSESFLVVPTLYFYPIADVEVWVWGGAVIGVGDVNKDDDPAYSFGSEIIANF